MSVVDFVLQYVEYCTKQGIADPNGICEKALVEIEELDKQIDAADRARVRRFHLTKVLKHFNHKSVFKVRNSKISPVANMETAEAAVSSATEEFMAKICDYVDSNESCTAGDILHAIGDYRHNEATFSSIKILCERGILIQKENRKIVKGPKWDER